jgi:hypothetical protein
VRTDGVELMVLGGKNTHLDDRKIRLKIWTIKNPGDSPGLPEIETRPVDFVKRPVEEERSISESDIFGLQVVCACVRQVACIGQGHGFGWDYTPTPSRMAGLRVSSLLVITTSNKI